MSEARFGEGKCTVVLDDTRITRALQKKAQELAQRNFALSVPSHVMAVFMTLFHQSLMAIRAKALDRYNALPPEERSKYNPPIPLHMLDKYLSMFALCRSWVFFFNMAMLEHAHQT